MTYGFFYVISTLRTMTDVGLPVGDFTQDYLFARAAIDGTDPYQPLNLLAERYMGSAERYSVPFATPHPPSLGLLFVPLTLLDPYVARNVWFIVEMSFLALAVYFVMRTMELYPSVFVTASVVAVLLCWYPVRRELELGQVMILLLLLLASAHFALRRGHPYLSGFLLGLAIQIKFLAWPLLLLLALRREWHALMTAAATVLVSYGITAWVIGVEAIKNYFVHVLPEDGALFRGEVDDISAWAIGWRIFQGTGQGVLSGIREPALISSPLLASLTSVAVPALILLSAFLWLRTRRNLDAAIGVMICVSLLVSPSVGDHYLVLLIIPAGQVFGLLSRHGFPPRMTSLVLLAMTPMLFLFGGWAYLAPRLPFGTAWLAAIPALGIGGLALMLARLSSQMQPALRST